MPGRNGIDAVRDIKKFYDAQRFLLPAEVVLDEPKIVILTAFATSAFKSHVASLGVSLVFEKPLPLD